MSSEPFTIAICTRNRANFLRRCLEALLVTTNEIDVPIMVIDNGSSDSTSEVSTAFGRRVVVLAEPEIGLSHARNHALAACDTEYLVFLDDDGIPDLTWGRAVATIAREGKADVFGGPYTPFYTTSKPAWFEDSLGSAHQDLVDGVQPTGVFLSGGNMGWRTEIIREAGGFDTALGVVGDQLRLGEETALQLALRRGRTDLTVLFSSSMSMRHHVGADKMCLSYIHKRNYIYGWQLADIDPTNPLNNLSFVDFSKRTKLGAPLLLRLFLRNRERYPFWRGYAAKYLSVNSIIFGAQSRRLLGNRKATWRTECRSPWAAEKAASR